MNQIGRLGVWANTNALSAGEAAAFARRVEQWGYSSLWIPESAGRNALVLAGWLLAHTQRLAVATGIANIYARDPQAMVSGQNALAEQSGNRFLLGLGVSHQPMVEKVRGHVYGKPVATMRAYLEAMARVSYDSPQPTQKPRTVLAALGPQMLALARDLTDGAHPYFVPPEHTAMARKALGPSKWLCVEQMLLLETRPDKAREAARKHAARYLAAANYRNNLMRLGYAEKELDGGGSDRVIDAIVAWGDESALRKRIQQHWDAGADHVCVQALQPDPKGPHVPHEDLLVLLAPAQ